MYNRSAVFGHLALRTLALAAVPSRQLLAAPALRASFAVVRALWSTSALRLRRSTAVGVSAWGELQSHSSASISATAAWRAAVSGTHRAARSRVRRVRRGSAWRLGLVAGRVPPRSVAAAVVGRLLHCRVDGVCTRTARWSIVRVGRSAAVGLARIAIEGRPWAGAAEWCWDWRGCAWRRCSTALTAGARRWARGTGCAEHVLLLRNISLRSLSHISAGVGWLRRTETADRRLVVGRRWCATSSVACERRRDCTNWSAPSVNSRRGCRHAIVSVRTLTD